MIKIHVVICEFADLPIVANVSNGRLQLIVYVIVFTCILFNRYSNKTNIKLFESYFFIMYINFPHYSLAG